MDNRHTELELLQLQALPLDLKIKMAKRRIEDWYNYFGGKVAISFSGGKDSTILVHLVRSVYPDVEAVFVDTGLEYPSLKNFVKSFDNVRILRPKKSFKQVLTDYGYPIFSKEIADKINLGQNAIRTGRADAKVFKYFDESYDSVLNVAKYKPLLTVDFRVSKTCCAVMKKRPIHEYIKETGNHFYVGTMAAESLTRARQWIKRGCNAYDLAVPTSKPLSIWTDSDILEYAVRNNLSISEPYGSIVKFGCKYVTTGCNRTGCIFCGYGAHLDRGKRFRELMDQAPALYEYCMGGGEYNESGYWVPNNEGLGFKHVYDTINSIYGEKFIKYKPDRRLF